jgi:cytochrome c556
MWRVLASLYCCVAVTANAADTRETVDLPAPMREHMLANMRDHLAALAEIQAALAAQDDQRVADIAESRLGFSSLASHNAAHMAKFMPPAMQAAGTAMHRAASELARSAPEHDSQKTLAALATLSAQCVACHAAYRLH